MMTLQQRSWYMSSLICIFLLSLVSVGYANPIPQLTIMTEEWEPYNFQQDGMVKGIATDILVLMLERVGSTQGRQDIQIYPWIRAYTMLQEEPGTLLFTTTRTDEREHLFQWVGPIFEIEFDIYALKNRQITIHTFEDLRGYKIGTLRGDVVEEMLIKKAGLTISDFQQVASNVQNIKKLHAGRIDLVPQSRDTTMVTCREAELNTDEFEAVFTLDKQGMYYAFHKETPDAVIALFQAAFDELKKEGKVAEIFHRYEK